MSWPGQPDKDVVATAVRLSCEIACFEDRRFKGFVGRETRGRLIRAAMSAASHAHQEKCAAAEATRAARRVLTDAGYGSIWISIALWAFTQFILPKILEWWRNRRSLPS